jgi:hypothetical protein
MISSAQRVLIIGRPSRHAGSCTGPDDQLTSVRADHRAGIAPPRQLHRPG